VSLERQDVRAKLDPEVHADLVAICDVRGITVDEFIEALLVPEVKRLMAEAHAIAARRPRRGITGKNREEQGEAGSVRERR